MRLRLLALIVGAFVLTGWLPPSPAQAADGLAIGTNAVYDVRPGDGIAIVTVNVVATNVTPDTATERFYYTGVSVPIPVGATGVSATSGDVVLPVQVSPADEHSAYAEVAFHVEVSFQQTYRFALTFVLADAGGDPERETWIRGSFVALPVRAYGDFGSRDNRVEVVLPAGFTVDVPHGEMEVAETDGVTRAVADSVDPGEFFAYVTAERRGQRARHEAEAPMATGPARLLLHAWPDDPDWSERQARILVAGLPRLEEEIGLSYPVRGTLHVSEHAYQHLGAYAGFFIGGIDTIEMRFDADRFTALHEAAHVWFNADLAEDRWLLEGFASYYAEVVGRALGEELQLPELTDDLREVSFPLLQWSPAGEDDSTREEYGYAASHEFARRIADLAGREALQAVWKAADAEELVYGRHPDEDGPARVPNPDDWRRFLDLFEEAGDADFDPLWQEWLLTNRQAEILAARDDARAAYRTTDAALGEWLMPATTRRHMEAWDFSKAAADLTRLDMLVADHATLLERADALDLAPSDEVGDLLGDSIVAAAGELVRHGAALDHIERATTRLAREPSPLERIGLLGADRLPADHLVLAREAFEAGDEDAARRESDEASALAAGAQGDGRLRVALTGGGILLADGIAMLALLLRRNRRNRSTVA